MLLAMAPEIHRTEIDGVPTFWADLPGPYRAQLDFGVGMRDEPPHLMGVTHLVEHLVFRSTGDVLLAHNGGTEVDHTWFSAWGCRDDVVDVVVRLAESMRDAAWTAADLDLEKRIIEVETGAGPAPARGVTTVRLGLGAEGNADAGAPTTLAVTLPETLEWARRWFVRQNASLWLTGPPPADLHLPLADDPGFRIDRAAWVERVAGQALVRSEKSGVALSLLCSSNDVHSLGHALAHELTAELRTRRGLVYDVDPVTKPLAGGMWSLDLVLDPLVDDTVEVVRDAVGLLRRIAREGLSHAAVQRNQHNAAAHMKAPVAWEHHLDSLCIAEIGGVVETLPPDALLQHIQTLEPGDLTGLLRGCLHSLLVFADAEADGVDEDLATSLSLRLEDDSLWRPGAARRRGGRRFRGSGVVGLRDSLSLVDGVLQVVVDGDVREIDLAQVVVAGRFADGSIGLMDVGGRSTVVDVTLWRQGGDVSKALLAAVPQHARRDFSWFDDPPYRRPPA